MAMAKKLNIDDLRLNYDPEKPQKRFKDANVEAALIKQPSGRLPKTVPWPAATKPKATLLKPAPAASDDLSRFAGYDAVVVTYTSAEAAALAALFTPNNPVSTWYEYRHDIAAYIPLVTGGMAPFKDKSSDMKRYYHSLGLYFPCTIGSAKVLLFKSGLHLDYDGPATPFQKLIDELATTIKPKVFITTGTGGGIGKDVVLGDVVIAPETVFDCATQFKNKPWKNGKYPTTPLPQKVLDLITPALTEVNAAHVTGGRKTPKIWSSPGDYIVTTDFFGFDDSTDKYKLEGLGLVCDMGDAMVGNVMQQHKNIKWFAVRNISDPQIANPTNDIEAAKKEAGQIYTKYGPFTTAASVICTWAIICATVN
jgi:nucleoside phosphorylase